MEYYGWVGFCFVFLKPLLRNGTSVMYFVENRVLHYVWGLTFSNAVLLWVSAYIIKTFTFGW